jgi:phage pi2 protein 07
MKVISVVLPLILAVSLTSCCEEKKTEQSQRSLEELVAILDQAEEEIRAKEIFDWKEEAVFQRKTVSDWTIAELNLVLEHWSQREEDSGRFFYWGDDLIERHAFIDEKPMCAKFLSQEADFKKLAHEAGKGLDQNHAESLLADHFGRFEAMIRGWSLRDPKAAWHSISHEDGCFFGTSLLKGFGYYLPRAIFKDLARVDSKYAVSEFLNHSQVDYPKSLRGSLAPGILNVMYQGSMLEGMARGLPDGFDWKALVEVASQLPEAKDREIKNRLRGEILARWMQDDVEAAITWFRSEAGQVISLEEVTIAGEVGEPFAPGLPKPPVKKVQGVSLRFAVTHWLGNDWEGAVQWLREHPDLIEEIIKAGEMSREENRRLMVDGQSPAAREGLVQKLLKAKKMGRVLSENNDWFPEKSLEDQWKQIEQEIAELEVSPSIAKELLKYRKANPSSNDDPFAD